MHVLLVQSIFTEDILVDKKLNLLSAFEIRGAYGRSSEFGPERLSDHAFCLTHKVSVQCRRGALRVSQGKCTWHWTTVPRTLSFDSGLLAVKEISYASVLARGCGRSVKMDMWKQAVFTIVYMDSHTTVCLLS
jgi:hypothetical protein